MADETKAPVEDVARAPSTSSEEEKRRELLSSFTPEDDKRIMRKVNYRFLWLISIMYLIKTVCLLVPQRKEMATNTDT
jgi:hypothetical protein